MSKKLATVTSKYDTAEMKKKIKGVVLAILRNLPEYSVDPDELHRHLLGRGMLRFRHWGKGLFEATIDQLVLERKVFINKDGKVCLFSTSKDRLRCMLNDLPLDTAERLFAENGIDNLSDEEAAQIADNLGRAMNALPQALEGLEKALKRAEDAKL